MTAYDSISDVELNQEYTRFLSKAGASDNFIDLLTFPKDVSGVARHSLCEEVRKYVYWGKLDPENDPATFSHCGGHFFSAMWDGDLFEAFLRADLNNKSLVVDCFGIDAIINSGVQAGQPVEYVRRMVTEPAL